MRRIALVTPVLLLPLLPLAPAAAADNVICVGAVAVPCDQTAATIPAALALANGNGVADTVRVGPGTYADGPYTLNEVADVTLAGSGTGATFVTLPPSVALQSYVTAFSAQVQDLTIQMAGGGTSSGDSGLVLGDGARAQNVRVEGPTTQNANGVKVTGSELVSSVVELAPGGDSRGVYSQGDSTVTDTVIVATVGYGLSALPADPDVISRSTIRAQTGVTLDGGTVAVDNSVIDLGTASSATGILAANFNSGTTPLSVTGDHLTIVGGGGSSRGVWAYAATPTARQTAHVDLTNSIVEGPATDLVVDAGNNGAQGGNSTAAIDVSHTDYGTIAVTIAANGAGAVVTGAGNLDLDPLFADAATGDFRLTPASPVVDAGDATAAPPAVDRNGANRVVDGDGDGTAVRDLGAFELPDTTAPQTVLVSGPSGLTKDATPTFTFASEPGATFRCRVDGAAFAACSGPGSSHTTGPLGQGAHTFRVVALDASGNADATPAMRTVEVDTVAPATTLTAKPAKAVAGSRVRFRFTSSEPGAFACRVDDRAWRACTSPAVFRVKVGRHRFAVRATDGAGNTDATPATYRFRRLPPR